MRRNRTFAYDLIVHCGAGRKAAREKRRGDGTKLKFEKSACGAKVDAQPSTILLHCAASSKRSFGGWFSEGEVVA